MDMGFSYATETEQFIWDRHQLRYPENHVQEHEDGLTETIRQQISENEEVGYVIH